MTACRVRHFVAVLALMLGPLPLRAQAVLAGVVRDDSTGKALAGVEVLLEGSKQKVTSDAAGRYVLDGLPNGNKVALFRFVGYRPVRMRVILTKGDTVRADAQLIREQAQELEPLHVTGAPAGRGSGLDAFEERRKLGFGKFIDSTELRRYQELRLADVLRRRGLNLLRMRDPRVAPQYPRYIMVAVNRHKIGPDGGPCPMQVILDNSVIYSPLTSRGFLTDMSEFLAGSLAAIEVYENAAETPHQFSGNGDECGTIVIWTRRH